MKKLLSRLAIASAIIFATLSGAQAATGHYERQSNLTVEVSRGHGDHHTRNYVHGSRHGRYYQPSRSYYGPRYAPHRYYGHPHRYGHPPRHGRYHGRRY